MALAGSFSGVSVGVVGMIAVLGVGQAITALRQDLW